MDDRIDWSVDHYYTNYNFKRFRYEQNGRCYDARGYEVDPESGCRLRDIEEPDNA